MTRVYRSLVTNVCKEMSCYSDFPFHEDYPNFMSHEKFWDYLREFAEHFGLLKYIRFKVRWVGLWKVPEWRPPSQQPHGNEMIKEISLEFFPHCSLLKALKY